MLRLDNKESKWYCNGIDFSEKYIKKRTGACKGLIGKIGEKPTRSRHCNGERPQEMPLEHLVLGRFERAMNQSQENCLFDNHRLTCERWGGDFAYG